jgi:hypothetical protein
MPAASGRSGQAVADEPYLSDPGCPAVEFLHEAAVIIQE